MNFKSLLFTFALIALCSISVIEAEKKGKGVKEKGKGVKEKGEKKKCKGLKALDEMKTKIFERQKNGDNIGIGHKTKPHNKGGKGKPKHKSNADNKGKSSQHATKRPPLQRRTTAHTQQKHHTTVRRLNKNTGDSSSFKERKGSHSKRKHSAGKRSG